MAKAVLHIALWLSCFSSPLARANIDDIPAESPDIRAFAGWYLEHQRLLSRHSPLPESEVSVGLRLAQARATEMLMLAERHPEQFVRNAISGEARARLPSSFQPFLERRYKGHGSFGVSCVLSKSEAGGDSKVHGAGLTREVNLDGVIYKAFVYGKWENQGTVGNVTIEGVILGDVIVLGDATAADEQANAGEPIVLSAPNPAGGNTLLYMVARFSDEAVDPIDDATALSQMGVVNTFWLNNSSGAVSIRGLVNPGQVMDIVHITLPQPMSYGSTYNNNFSVLLSDARNAASALGYNYANYNLDVVVTSDQSFSYGGRSWVGQQGAHLVKPDTTLRTAGHELAHNFGLRHANYWRTDAPVPFGKDSVPGGYVADSLNAEWIEYGHYFSIMGAQSGSEMNDPDKPHYAPAEKVALGWLTGSGVRYVNASGTNRLFRLDHRDTVGTPRGLRIEVPATDYTGLIRHYWLSYRYAPWIVGQNWLRNGVQMDVCKPAYGADGATLLDMTPYSNDDPAGATYLDDNTDKMDAALVVGRTYSDYEAGIHITPIATNTLGTSQEYIDVVINLGSFTGNHPPVITNFFVSTNQVATGQNVNFTVSATDPDGDGLAYAWDFDQVQVWTQSGLNSPTATKSWPAAGQYRVMVTVSDMKGGVATKSTIVTVGAPVNDRQIAGRVLWGGSPVYPARVWTTSGSTVYQAWTDAQGAYVLTDLPSTNSYTLRCIRDELTFATQFPNPVSVASGNAFGKDFYATELLPGGGGLATYSLSGQIIDGGTGVRDVEVRAGGLLSRTDFYGNYQFTNLTSGTYTVVPRFENWTFSPSNRIVVLSSLSSSSNDFSRSAPYSISGRIDGLPTGNQDSAPSIYLSNGKTVDARLVTGSDKHWEYTLTNVPAGQYSVSAELYGFRIVPSGFANPLTISANRTGISFSGAVSILDQAIDGRITERGLPLAGITVQALQSGTNAGVCVTDSDGYYRIVNLNSDAYTLLPSRSEYSFSPSSLSNVYGGTSGNNFAGLGPNTPPSISSVRANPAVVPTVSSPATLSVLASGTAPLNCSWDALLAPVAVTFSVNDSASATSTIVSFQAPGNYTFRVRVTDANSVCATSSVSLVVSAGAGVMVVSPYEVQVPANKSVTFRADAWDQLGNKITVTPTWSVSGGGSINSTGLFSAIIPGGPYSVTAVADVLTATGTVWVLPPQISTPPSITTQPASQTVAVGSNATFTVAATGTPPLTYQWFFNGSAIAGATASTCSLTNAQLTNAGNYSVQVTNAAGIALSSNAVLKILPSLTISAQNTNKLYGAPLPAFTPVYAGFVNGETSDSLDSQPVLTTTATLSSPVGNYPITVSGAASTNYIIVYVPGTLLITPAATTGLLTSSANPAPTGQPVTFIMALNPVPPGAGAPSGTVQFKIDGANAGAPVSLSGAVASSITPSLTHGAHTVSAAYGGDGNFLGVTNFLAPDQLINSTPLAMADTIQRDRTNGTKVAIPTLLTNDTDPDGDLLSFLTFSATTAQGGTVVSNDNWLFYTPPAGFTNTDSFTYSISDTFGATATATVTIAIRADNSQPPNLTVTNVSTGVYQIRGDGIPGLTYRIQATEDIQNPNWQTLGEATADSSGIFVFTDSPVMAQRFYRSVYP